MVDHGLETRGVLMSFLNGLLIVDMLSFVSTIVVQLALVSDLLISQMVNGLVQCNVISQRLLNGPFKRALLIQKKIAIMGGSYGGYATLAGITITPHLYACGVDIVGPSHVKTLFQSIPPYWTPMKKQLILRIGDVENDEELNRRISPLFHVDNIRVPLIIGQGANDPRVKQAESDQIVQALREKNLPYEYIIYTDEGHGFARPPNRLHFYSRVEKFLSHHLGGRFANIPSSAIESNTAIIDSKL